MQLSERLLFACLCGYVAGASCGSAAGQTLEHRLPANPEQPAAAKSDEPAAVLHPVLPAGTNMQVEVTRHYPMRKGEAIEGRLLHPIFAEGRLAVAEGCVVHGKVVGLEPDREMRWHGRLRGDLTPFHTVQVQFDNLVLRGGAIPIAAETAKDGAPVLHLAAPGATPQQSLIGRYWAQAKGQMHDRAVYFTAPGFGDRALQVLYHQLPYHPERIEAHTMWSFDLTAPLKLPEVPGGSAGAPQTESSPGKAEIWSVHALLANDLTSATAKPGDPIEGLVVEPVFDKEQHLVVPQGSVLMGRVSEAKAARALGRNGKLRFNFQQVRFPEGTGQQVRGSLSGATAESRQDLALDAEGTITPRNQSSVIAPLLLTVLAGRALDQDGNLTAQAGVASNGFGLVGRIVGVASGSRNVAAGIGYYAAGLSVYENFLRQGRNVIFPKNTRIEIETTPLRSPALKPESR